EDCTLSRSGRKYRVEHSQQIGSQCLSRLGASLPARSPSHLQADHDRRVLSWPLWAYLAGTWNRAITTASEHTLRWVARPQVSKAAQKTVGVSHHVLEYRAATRPCGRGHHEHQQGQCTEPSLFCRSSRRVRQTR